MYSEPKSNRSSMKIKTAAKEDIHIIQDIAHKTWPISYADMISQAQIEYMLDMMYNDQTLHNQMESGHEFYILEIENNSVGFAGIEPLKKESYIFIHKLYVLPSFQGKGIGKELVNYVIGLASEWNLKEVRLNVNRTNKAVQFYIKNGFEILKSLDIDIGSGFYMNDYSMNFTIAQ